MHRHLTVLVAAAAVLLTAAPAASAATATETASSGPVTATFTYRKARDFTFSDLALKIVRNGVVAVDGPIGSAACQDFCAPGGAFFGDEPSVKVTDLDGDGEPEVVLDLFTGGAHCCVVTEIYALQGSPAAGLVPGYSREEHNFLDPGYRLADIDGDGRPEFQSADGRIAYALSSYAGSGVPVQIWRFQQGSLVDVTADYPALIKADSRHWYKRYRRYAAKTPPNNDPGLGALAAWAADEYRLGHGTTVQKELKLALRRGWLDGIFGSGRRALRDLNTLLSETGYR